MKTWAGGAAIYGLPLRPRSRRFRAPQAPGLSNTRYKHKKEKRNIGARNKC